MVDESGAPTPSFFADSISLLRVQCLSCNQSRIFSEQNENLWELIYVDCGVLTLSEKKRQVTLSPNCLFLHAKSCRSDLRFLSGNIRRAFLFTFSCRSPYLSLLADQLLSATKIDRIFLAGLLMEAISQSQVPSSRNLNRKQSVPLNQMAPLERISLLEQLLDRLFLRSCLPVLPFVAADQNLPPSHALSSAELQYFSVLRYLKAHLFMPLSIEQICRDTFTSRSHLEFLFHEKGWHGVIDCFSNMKIDAAKQLIADDTMTFSQISAVLGYSSGAYFSRQFKKATKMTPTEYSCFLKEHSGDVIPSLNRYYTITSRL